MLKSFWFLRIRILSCESFGRFNSQMISSHMMLWWRCNLSPFRTKFSGGWSWAMITTFRRAWVAAPERFSCICLWVSYHLATTECVRWVELRSRRIICSSLLRVSTMFLWVLNSISVESTHQIVILIKVDRSWWGWGSIIASADLYIVVRLPLTIRSDIISIISWFMLRLLSMSRHPFPLRPLAVSGWFLLPC